MSDVTGLEGLGVQLHALITGGRSQATETGRQALGAIERAAGSGRRAAAMVGVSPSTWRRWKAGGGRSAHSTELLKVAARIIRVPAGREARIRGGDRGVTVPITYKNDPTRQRDVGAGSLGLTPGTLGRVLDVYFSGGNNHDMGKAFTDGITDPFYQDWFQETEESDYGFFFGAIKVG